MKACLGWLLELAEARQTAVGEVGLRVYVRELVKCDQRDVETALRQLGAEQPEEYRSPFPALGTVLARVKQARVQRMTPPKWTKCEACSVEGMVLVDSEGRPWGDDPKATRFMRECVCKRDWRRAKRRHEQEQAGEVAA